MLSWKRQVNNAPLGRVIGQYDNGIILSEVVDGIVIIDQHAAYENYSREIEP